MYKIQAAGFSEHLRSGNSQGFCSACKVPGWTVTGSILNGSEAPGFFDNTFRERCLCYEFTGGQ